LTRIKALLEQRGESYAQAHHTIQTDDLAPEQTAQRILELSGMGADDPHLNPPP
jgi:shikimate kinase